MKITPRRALGACAAPAATINRLRRERGVAPRKLIATKFNSNDASKGIAMQRPICPYPNEAIYKGTGDSNDASNFYCGRRAP